MRERRFEPRHSITEPVELTWTDGTATGKLTDLSRSGARLSLDRPIRVETPVRVALGGVSVTGRVSSCSKQETGYTLGVVFDPEFEGVLKRKK